MGIEQSQLQDLYIMIETNNLESGVNPRNHLIQHKD